MSRESGERAGLRSRLCALGLCVFGLVYLCRCMGALPSSAGQICVVDADCWGGLSCLSSRCAVGSRAERVVSVDGGVETMGVEKKPELSSPTCQGWVKYLGGTDLFQDLMVLPPNALALGQGGELYTVSSFSGVRTMLGRKWLARGGHDFVLAKLSGCGEVRWTKQYGGPGEVFGTQVAVDRMGHIYVGGTFTQRIVFGKQEYQSAGEQDGFIAKLGPDGEPIWLLQIGGKQKDTLVSLALDGEANPYVLVAFGGKVTFGKQEFTSVGDVGLVLSRLDGQGGWSWSRQLQGAGLESRAYLAVKDSTVAVAGTFSGQLTMGSQVLKATEGKDVFLVRWETNGQWVGAVGSEGGRDTRAGGGVDEQAGGLVLDSGGGALLAGNFRSTLRLGALPVSPEDPEQAGFFVARSAADGSWSWRMVVAQGGVEPRGLFRGFSGFMGCVGSYLGAPDFRVPLPKRSEPTALVAQFKATSSLAKWTKNWTPDSGVSVSHQAVYSSEYTLFVIGYAQPKTLFAGERLVGGGKFAGFLWRVR